MSVIEFPNPKSQKSPPNSIQDDTDDEEVRSWGRPYQRHGRNMQSFVFRSYDLIVQSDEADLVRDVGLDIEKAQNKLRRTEQTLKSVQKQANARIELLNTAKTKLKAAIVVALLSGQK